MVKDHSDGEKGNPLPPHRLLIPISSKVFFICTIPQTGQHTTAFVTPVVEHWLEREIALWDHAMKDRSDDASHHERTLLPRSYISLPGCMGVSTCTRPPISSEPRLALARERPGGVGAHGVRATIMRAVRTLVHIWIKERNVLFNDALNTCYLRLYGVRHMVKDHSDSEKGNPLSPHRLLLSINSKGSSICTIPQTG